jgi:predicted acetyltransferase
MHTQGPRLVEPSPELKEQFFAFARDYEATRHDIQDFRDAMVDFPAYVQKCTDYSIGRNLKPGHVPASTFWLMAEDDSIVGWVNIRHGLTDNLKHRGGHVGYYIRPGYRRKGYGTLICKLGLEKACELGIRPVLITCAKDNIGSNRIIQKNGGVLENEIWDEQDQEMVCRYWIDL